MNVAYYYIGLVIVMGLVFIVNLIIELIKPKPKSDSRCSFCNLDVGNKFGMSLGGTLFCRRWWCKLFRELGFLKAK